VHYLHEALGPKGNTDWNPVSLGLWWGMFYSLPKIFFCFLPSHYSRNMTDLLANDHNSFLKAFLQILSPTSHLMQTTAADRQNTATKRCSQSPSFLASTSSNHVMQYFIVSIEELPATLQPGLARHVMASLWAHAAGSSVFLLPWVLYREGVHTVHYF